MESVGVCACESSGKKLDITIAALNFIGKCADKRAGKN
ncbi:MAG: hypothetical protein ACI9VT_003617 [Psychroserpens sp.]